MTSPALRLRLQLLDGGYQEVPLPEYCLGIDILAPSGRGLTVNRGPNDVSLEVRSAEGNGIVYVPVANNSGYVFIARYTSGAEATVAWLRKGEAVENAESLARLAAAREAEAEKVNAQPDEEVAR